MPARRRRVLLFSLLIALLPLLLTEVLLRLSARAPAAPRAQSAVVADYAPAMGERSSATAKPPTSRGAVWPERQAVSGGGAPIPTVTATPQPTRSPSPSPSPGPSASPSPAAVLRAAANDPRVLERLRGFAMPIKGATLSTWDTDLPGATRSYRAGTHEGIDFYNGAIGVPLGIGTEVLAVQDGKVTRVDVDYQETSREEMRVLLSVSQRLGYTPPDIVDRLRGREVIIDHGDGIVTRYDHLDGVPAGLRVGSQVRREQVIGYVGNSGTPEAAMGNDVGPHLHVDILIDGQYLGWGLSVQETRLWLEQTFGSP